MYLDLIIASKYSKYYISNLINKYLQIKKLWTKASELVHPVLYYYLN